MAKIPILKFGGRTLQGIARYGPNEDDLLDECHRAASVNEIYRNVQTRRNVARARRLHQIARQFILPLKEQGLVPVIVVSAFDWATDKLEQLAECVCQHPDDREYARLLMSGELRANSALSIALKSVSCPAYSLTGREAGIKTSAQYVGAVIEAVHKEYIHVLVEKGIVPVVAGFQGYFTDQNTRRQEVAILGRGGSNLTAVALAEALDQPECTMFTNVDGLYDKDPLAHHDAKKIDAIDADELLQWDPFPDVIQREAVEHASERGVNIWIRDGFNPDVSGSKIICK